MCKNNAIGQFDRYGREGVKDLGPENGTKRNWNCDETGKTFERDSDGGLLENVSSVSLACRKRRLNGAVSWNKRI